MAIAFVQQAHDGPNSTSFGGNASMGPQTAGNCNIAIVTLGINGSQSMYQTLLGVSDTAGNTYTPVASSIQGNFNGAPGDPGGQYAIIQQMYLAINIFGGSGNVVTEVIDQVADFASITVLEVSGINAVDVSNGATATGPSATTTVSPGSITTTKVNEYIVGAYCCFSGIATTAAGYTSRAGFWAMSVQERIVTSAGTQTVTVTAPGTDGWIGQIASFYQTSSGGVQNGTVTIAMKRGMVATSKVMNKTSQSIATGMSINPRPIHIAKAQCTI